jgi:hypothetical protein
MSGACLCMIGLVGLGLGAIVRHGAAAKVLFVAGGWLLSRWDA